MNITFLSMFKYQNQSLYSSWTPLYSGGFIVKTKSGQSFLAKTKTAKSKNVDVSDPSRPSDSKSHHIAHSNFQNFQKWKSLREQDTAKSSSEYETPGESQGELIDGMDYRLMFEQRTFKRAKSESKAKTETKAKVCSPINRGSSFKCRACCDQCSGRACDEKCLCTCNWWLKPEKCNTKHKTRVKEIKEVKAKTKTKVCSPINTGPSFKCRACCKGCSGKACDEKCYCTCNWWLDPEKCKPAKTPSKDLKKQPIPHKNFNNFQKWKSKFEQNTTKEETQTEAQEETTTQSMEKGTETKVCTPENRASGFKCRSCCDNCSGKDCDEECFCKCNWWLKSKRCESKRQTHRKKTKAEARESQQKKTKTKVCSSMNRGSSFKCRACCDTCSGKACDEKCYCTCNWWVRPKPKDC